MRKILSLILSAVILLCTLSVLTVLPVVATTTPANLIINGDAESGNWTADTFKDSNYANIGLIMGANKSFHNYGWYATNDWGEAAAINLSSNAKGATFSNYSGNNVMRVTNWQTAFQDIAIEKDKTYTVSAKITTLPTDLTNFSGYFEMCIEPVTLKDKLNSKGASDVYSTITGKDWNLYNGHADTKAKIDAQCAKNMQIGTSNNYWDGDFVDYSFTFNSNDFINEYKLTENENGKFDCRIAILNGSNVKGGTIIVDDVSMGEAIAVTAREGGYVDTAAVSAGSTVTVTATPYYGNTFKGWYNENGNLVSANATYTGVINAPIYAEFNIYNQISDGSFQGGDGVDAWITAKAYQSMTFTVSNGMNDQSGMKATTASDSFMAARMPVTVKKDTSYVMSYNMKVNSYAPTGTATPVYGMMVAGSTTGANSWGWWPTLEYYDIIIRSADDYSKFYKLEKYNSIENYQIPFADIEAACGTGWLEVIIEFGTGHDTTTKDDGNMFESSDTATFYMAMGTNKSSTDINYDNFSFYEKKTVGFTGKENVRAERVGLGVVASGLPYSFRLRHDDNVVLKEVTFNGTAVTAENGIYNVTLADTNTISVSASNDANYPALGKDYNGKPLDKWNVPLYNLPYWEGNTVYQENVIFYPGRTSAKLLYPIDNIVSVRSYDLETYYVKGVDFDIVDGEFVLLEGTSIPVFPHKPLVGPEDSGYSGGNASDIEGYKVARYWEYDTCNYTLSITYTHTKHWTDGYKGVSQPSVEDQLPEVFEKLKNDEDVHVVFYGDSMTSGMSASGGLSDVYNTDNSSLIEYGWWLPPFTPNWMTLFIEGLKTMYPSSNITWENLSLGGQTADWGAKNIEARYDLLEKEPDLFLIGFGINDDGKGNVTKDAFKASTQGIIDFIKETKNDTSILLYGGNAVNENRNIYEQATIKLFASALDELGEENDNVAATRLTDIYMDMATVKEACDLFADNGVHAGDFGCRVYAQTMLCAMRTKGSLEGDGDFETLSANVNDFINKTEETSIERAEYTADDKNSAGYEDGMGSHYLKVTKATGSDNHCDISIPVNLERGKKYVAHFKYKVLESYAADKKKDTRFDLRVTKDPMIWDAPIGIDGKIYLSAAKGKYLETHINAFFKIWYSAAFENIVGHDYMDAYIVIDATNVANGTYYLTAGLKNGGVYAIDDISFDSFEALAPQMMGATINFKNNDQLVYATDVNLPDFLAISGVKTFMAISTSLTEENATSFNDTDNPEYVSSASLSAFDDIGIITENNKAFTKGRLYAKFNGARNAVQTRYFSVRSEIAVTDRFGNNLGITLSTSDNNSADTASVTNGVYKRSITQIKRLMAKKLINDLGVVPTDEQIPQVGSYDKWNCDIEDVWNFVLENEKAFE